MKDVQELFFVLLRMALGQEYGEMKELSKEDWKTLYDLADRHTVLGVCLAGLDALDKRGKNRHNPCCYSGLAWPSRLRQETKG